jgi:hypothetical protein
MEHSFQGIVKNYVYTLVETHSGIRYEEHLVQNIKRMTVSAQEDAIRYERKKIKLA